MAKDAEIKKQVEYYLSDQNLKQDTFFHGLISANKEGFINIELVLKCNKIKKLKASEQDIARVVKDSDQLEVSEDGKQIRRKGNKKLPKLVEAKPKRQQKGDTKEEVKKEEEPQNSEVFEQEDVADPIILEIKRKDKEETKTNWKDIEDFIKDKYRKLKFLYSRLQDGEGHIAFSSRKLDQKTLGELVEKDLVVKDTAFSIKKLEDKDQKNFWEEHGTHFQFCTTRKLDYFKRKAKKQKTGSKQEPVMKKKAKVTFTLGGTEFEGIEKVKSKARTIMNLKENGQALNAKEQSFLLDILKHHSKFEQKGKDLKNFIVDNHPDYDNTRCFFVVRNDGTKEDFSLSKCIENMNQASQKEEAAQ